jgi:SAM-dependent MidA family methyltransferase
LVRGAIPQKAFLEGLGIKLRLEQLSNNATVSQKHDLEQQYQRLCGLEEMGALFKVIAFHTYPNLQLSGFEDAV